jgi:predicted methyltransferase
MKKTFAILLLTVLTISVSHSTLADALWSAVAGDQRQEKNVIRDVYRNPYETLSFFGIEEDMTVLENWPGGGWYTEILGAYLKDKGQLIAATYDRNPKTQKSWQAGLNKSFDENFVAKTELYGKIAVVGFSPGSGDDLAKPGTVDAILDFRNAHNWIKSAPDAVPEAWHKSLKKGGIVGLVDHRMDAKKPYNPKNGYVHEAQIVEIMEKHGFKFIGKSEINSNARDTKDHPSGVWTLPPTLARKAEEKNKYLAIGESDRLVMKFEKI